MGVTNNNMKLQTTYRSGNQCIRPNNAANAFNDNFINIMDALPKESLILNLLCNCYTDPSLRDFLVFQIFL
jgi:hypothetical protein